MARMKRGLYRPLVMPRLSIAKAVLAAFEFGGITVPALA